MVQTPSKTDRLDPGGASEVRNLAIAFNHLMDERDAISTMKDQFVSNVSHELRTPLTSINGALRLIDSGATGNLPARAQAMNSLALRNGQRLQLLISDLLDFGKLSAGQMSVTLAPELLQPIIESTVLDNQTMADENKVVLTAQGNLRQKVITDPHRLRQILDNFVSNAIKFSPANGNVRIFVEPGTAGSTRIVVQDHGDGVPETFVEHLFDRFSQADTGNTKTTAGTGLGLAICRELAALMNGRLGYYYDQAPISGLSCRLSEIRPESTMKAPEIPSNELERQFALDQSGLLDSNPEERFDRFTRMACKMFDVPIALVSLIDRNRQWFKSCQGLAVPETPRDISFCGHAILHSDLFIIEDTLQDDRFNDNPLVRDAPFIRFYAGAPLHNSEGYRLGTMCLIDRKPRRFDGEDQALLRELADCIEREINIQAASEFYIDLKRSERRARAVIDGTKVGTWEWNVQTGETVFNKRWAEICGYRLEELEPVSIQTWRNLAHPEDLAESERLLTALFDGAMDEYDYRCRMRHKDGHWVWVHDRGQVFEWTSEGQPLRMYGTHADISAEMANLEKMQQQNTALSILNDLALDPETDDDTRIRKALKLGADYLDLPLAIVSEITGTVYTVRWFDAPEDAGLSAGQSFALGDTYCSITVDCDESLSIEHMARSPYRSHRCYNQFGLESYVAAPIYLQNKLFGTLNFSSPTPRFQAFPTPKLPS
ncbi:GAF domain-containing protein [Marinobacter similis]|uniref:GAF domain-containing protein n=1 Tax=Marinobacter similis TaxID=1420916 RepID=UPI000AEC8556